MYQIFLYSPPLASRGSGVLFHVGGSFYFSLILLKCQYNKSKEISFVWWRSSGRRWRRKTLSGQTKIFCSRENISARLALFCFSSISDKDRNFLRWKWLKFHGEDLGWCHFRREGGDGGEMYTALETFVVQTTFTDALEYTKGHEVESAVRSILGIRSDEISHKPERFNFHLLPTSLEHENADRHSDLPRGRSRPINT